MTLSSPGPICERARGQISLSLDGEVSEFERRLVSAHLARCADCTAFEASLRGFTEQLRGAPLQAPRQVAALPQARRRVSLGMAQYSAAATLLIAVLGVMTQFVVREPEGSGARVPARTANLFETAWQPELELAQLDHAPRPRGLDRPGPTPAL